MSIFGISTASDSQGLDYNVDIVMCIDATGSMHSIINKVKADALNLYTKFVEEMSRASKGVQGLRIKVIVFRDYGCDSAPMVESPFFVLDEQSDEFKAFLDGVEATGGGDLAENSLEALALAMNSDWTTDGSVRRHVIVMYTDAPALDFSARCSTPGYPAGMPANLAELREWWEGQKMEARAKRLLIFAPDCEPWANFNTWSNAFHTVSTEKGCDDTDIDTCIHLLVNSI